MATENFVQPVIPRFDGHYDHWRMLMENFLRSMEYWQVVSDGVPELTATMSDAQKTEREGMKLKDLKAKNYMFQAIDFSILEMILCKYTSKFIWDFVMKMYQVSTKAKRQQLSGVRLEFETLRIKFGESVTNYYSRAIAIVNKMWIHGDKTEDVTIVEKILRSLTPKFNFIIYAIEEFKYINLLSIDELQSSLLVQNNVNQQEKEEQALKPLMKNHFIMNRVDRG